MTRLRKLVATLAFVGLTPLASAAGYAGLYIFGDSLADAGNVAALIGANPGQVISGNAYIPSQPYASGQFTNGDVWAKGFATSLGFSSSGLPSITGGGNYAFGGARIATDGAGLTPSLSAQTNLFLAASGGVAPGGALYVLEGGGNDGRDILQAAATSMTPNAVIAAGAASFAQAAGILVDRLQAAGAQSIIVWDIPNLALAPAITIQGAGASFLGGQVSLAMNAALAARMAGESGVKIFDVYGLQNSFATNPAAFGLTNVTDACGAPTAGCNPATSLFWDGIHPTAAGHALLAQAMLVTAVPEPETYVLLLGGLFVVALQARRHVRAVSSTSPG